MSIKDGLQAGLIVIGNELVNKLSQFVQLYVSHQIKYWIGPVIKVVSIVKMKELEDGVYAVSIPVPVLCNEHEGKIFVGLEHEVVSYVNISVNETVYCPDYPYTNTYPGIDIGVYNNIFEVFLDVHYDT